MSNFEKDIRLHLEEITRKAKEFSMEQKIADIDKMSKEGIEKICEDFSKTINMNSLEQYFNISDFVLAQYLFNTLYNLSKTLAKQEELNIFSEIERKEDELR